jgi:hypothetical protein
LGQRGADIFLSDEVSRVYLKLMRDYAGKTGSGASG